MGTSESPKLLVKTGIRRIPRQGPATGFDEVDEAVVQCSRDSRDDRSEWVASQVPGCLERGSETAEGVSALLFGIQRENRELRCFTLIRRGIEDLVRSKARRARRSLDRIWLHPCAIRWARDRVATISGLSRVFNEHSAV